MLKQTAIISSTALLLSLGMAYAQQAKRGQPRIPVPAAALLKAQPAPACEYRASNPVATLTPGSPKGGSDDATTEAAALRTKLDYERQCYRHAEMIVRQRLEALQVAVRGTIRAIDREQLKGAQAPRRAKSRIGGVADGDGNEP
jgi:hypothetical protein